MERKLTIETSNNHLENICKLPNTVLMFHVSNDLSQELLLHFTDEMLNRNGDSLRANKH